MSKRSSRSRRRREKRYTIPPAVSGEWGIKSIEDELKQDKRINRDLDGSFTTTDLKIAREYASKLRGSSMMGKCCDFMPRCEHWKGDI